MQPAISVVMPVFNAGRWLGATLAGILQQTYRNFELVIVDDGSSDDSAAIIEACRDSRIRLFRTANEGPSRARNRGVDEARAELIAFCDADDLWTPDKLERQLAALQRQPQVALVYSWTDAIDEQGRFLQAGSHVDCGVEINPYALLLTRNFLDCGSTPLVRRSALRAAGMFDPALRGGEDWDLWLRIAWTGRFACVPAVQVLYRVHAQAASSDIERQAAQSLAVIARAASRLPPGLDRERAHRLGRASIHRYVAIRLIRTGTTRSAARAAANHWWQFVRATPTPLAHAGKALLVLAAILAMSLLPPALFGGIREALANRRRRVES